MGTNLLFRTHLLFLIEQPFGHKKEFDRQVSLSSHVHILMFVSQNVHKLELKSCTGVTFKCCTIEIFAGLEHIGTEVFYVNQHQQHSVVP